MVPIALNDTEPTCTPFIIGDKTVDIQTGKNAGLNTILVRTGYGGSDNIFNCTADHIFKDLYESVDFIINST